MAHRKHDGHGHPPPHGPAASPAGDHRAAGPASVTVQVVTVSDTRTAADDRSGALLAELFRAAGHTVREVVIVKDDAAGITKAVTDATRDPAVRAVVLNGGTGISKRDVTYETVKGLVEKELPGFGEIFRQLSWQEIGSAAFLSRAMAGVRGRVVVFALPGSTNAVRLAAEKLILPELPHLARELDK